MRIRLIETIESIDDYIDRYCDRRGYKAYTTDEADSCYRGLIAPNGTFICVDGDSHSELEWDIIDMGESITDYTDPNDLSVEDGCPTLLQFNVIIVNKSFENYISIIDIPTPQQYIALDEWLNSYFSTTHKSLTAYIFNKYIEFDNTVTISDIKRYVTMYK